MPGKADHLDLQHQTFSGDWFPPWTVKQVGSQYIYIYIAILLGAFGRGPSPGRHRDFSNGAHRTGRGPSRTEHTTTGHLGRERNLQLMRRTDTDASDSVMPRKSIGLHVRENRREACETSTDPLKRKTTDNPPNTLCRAWFQARKR